MNRSHVHLLFARVIAAALALFALTTTGLAHAAPTDRIDAPEITQVRMINSYRRSRGLAPLRIDVRLTRAAHWQALDMGTTRRFSHVDSRGRGTFTRLRAFGYPSTTWRGENLAAGNPGARATWRQWLHSPPHRHNWDVPAFRAIGIARVYVSGSPFGWYWATTFGSRFISPA